MPQIKFLTGDFENLVKINKLPSKSPFDEHTINFLNDLSQELILNPDAKSFSDVITFAFWIRKASVLKLKERFFNLNNNVTLGKGVVFHIAPSNVPVNFAFSLVSGLLTGNANIVKVPSSARSALRTSNLSFKQVDLIVSAVNKVLDKAEYADLKNYIYLIRYERENAIEPSGVEDVRKDINDFLSAMADMRVIWGGDNTINEIRKSPLPPRSGEITFADRYSLAVIDADFYLNLDDKAKNKAAQDFYNDTFFTDQNACTSPRIVIWTGDNNIKAAAKNEFWRREHELVKNKYAFQDIQAVNKFTSFCLLAANKNNVKLSEHDDNLIICVQVPEISADLMQFRDNSGYFLEYECEDLSEIKNLLDDKKCQTIAYLGSSEILNALINLVKAGIKGIDRIVPFGKTMDFDLIWDGYNLFSELTRTVKIEF